MQRQAQHEVISEGRQHKVSSEANCFSCKLPICALHQRHITPCSNDPSMQHQAQHEVISEGRQHKVSSEANCFSCKLPICALHQRHITPCSNDPSMQHQAQHEVISEGRQHKVSSEANCFSCKLPICALHQRHITPNDPSTPRTFTLASLHNAMQHQGQQQATSHCCFTIVPQWQFWGSDCSRKAVP